MISFIHTRSPKGGKQISRLRISIPRRRPNVIITKTVEEAVIEDFYCYKIGYDNEGTELYIKPSDVEILKKALKKCY